MKFLKFALVLSLFIWINENAMAASAPNQNSEDLRQTIESIVNQRTKALQEEVSHLRKEVKQMNGNANNDAQAAQTNYQPQAPARARNAFARKKGRGNETLAQRYFDIFPKELHPGHPLLPLYLGGTPVVTGPYIGINSAYDGSNLIVNAPSINLTPRLLKQVRAWQDDLLKDGFQLPSNPMVELSGKIEATLWAQNETGISNRAGLDLGSASLEPFIWVNPWVNGYIQMDYDNYPSSPFQVANSRVVLAKAFINIGNLSRSPLYASIGQNFIPFGRYNTYMIDPTMPQLLSRSKQRAAVIGIFPMEDKGVYAATYIYRSATETYRQRQSGLNLGYKNSIGRLDFDVSGSYTTSLPDAYGMQLAATPASLGFTGFAMNEASEQLSRGVPAADATANLSLGSFTIFGEYVTATHSFNGLDMTYNGSPARPSAAHGEGAYMFNYRGKPGSIAISYDWTRDALALFLPKRKYTAAVNYAYWRNTLASLQYSHLINYGPNTTATGAGSPLFGPAYQTADVYTFQLGIYF